MTTRRGFSEMVFDISSYSIPTIGLILYVVTEFYDFLISLKKGNKFVVLTRLEFADGSVITLHKSVKILLDPQFVTLLWHYLLDILSLKNNDYDLDDRAISKIVFNFFWIPNHKVSIADDKWTDLNKSFAKSPEVINFQVGRFAGIFLFPTTTITIQGAA